MAATAYSKVNNEVALLMVTSGCGSTNAITGILDAWQDSNKVFVISGQANSNELRNPYLTARNTGIQHVDIITMVRDITKYSEMLTVPQNIPAALEIAYENCISGRPGPVWLDIPLDVQAMEI